MRVPKIHARKSWLRGFPAGDQALRMLTTECGRGSPEIRPSRRCRRRVVGRMKPVQPDIPVLLCMPELAGKRHSRSAFLTLVSRIPRGRVRSSRLGGIVATTPPADRRIQREVAVNTPCYDLPLRKLNYAVNQPSSYPAEAGAFLPKTRVFCMQVNPVTEKTPSVGAVQ